MQKKEETRPARGRIAALAGYTAALCLCAQVYVWLAGYELFLQTLAALFPVVACVTLLLLVVANAILLSSRISLWSLCIAHIFVSGWWQVSLHMQRPSGFRKFETLWDSHNLILLILSLLPPLLGYALLCYRWQRLQAVHKKTQ